jgi:hypothetical protein
VVAGDLGEVGERGQVAVHAEEGLGDEEAAAVLAAGETRRAFAAAASRWG